MLRIKHPHPPTLSMLRIETPTSTQVTHLHPTCWQQKQPHPVNRQGKDRFFLWIDRETGLFLEGSKLNARGWFETRPSPATHTRAQRGNRKQVWKSRAGTKINQSAMSMIMSVDKEHLWTDRETIYLFIEGLPTKPRQPHRVTSGFSRVLNLI